MYLTVVMTVTKQNDGFNPTPEWAARFHFSAHSPSGTNRPDDLEFFEKVVARPDRISNPWPVAPHAGSCVHDYVTDVVAKDISQGEAYRAAMARYDEHVPAAHIHGDAEKTALIRDGEYSIPKSDVTGTIFELTCANTLEGVRQATAGANLVTEGRWCSTELPDCELPAIGQIDLETGDVIEMKTKWPQLSSTTERGWRINSVPAKPDQAHVAQVAFYWSWLRQARENVDVKIIYANCKNFRVFSSADCEELGEARLRSALERMRLVARKREKLMQLAENREELFSLLAPDFSHFMWNSVSPEFMQRANQVWGV